MNPENVSPLPWSVKRTGGEIAILDASKKVVIKKVVSSLSIEQYQALSANFDFIVAACNNTPDPVAWWHQTDLGVSITIDKVYPDARPLGFIVDQRS